MSDFWNEYEKADREEGGGGGIVCQANIRTGYKAYITGLGQEETFFDAPASSKAARKKAKAEATKLTTAHGEKQPRWSVLIHVPKDKAMRVIDNVWQDVTWQGDRYFVVNTWVSAAKEVVVPSIKAAGVTDIPCSIWCRIGFKPDPYKEGLGEAGMTDEDQDGNPRYPQIAYVVEAFDDLNAARVACGLETDGKPAASASDGPPLPVDWEGYEDGWRKEMSDIKAEYPGPLPRARKALEANAEKLAAEHSCTPADVLAWYNEV